jgi:hypothetical protein
MALGYETLRRAQGDTARLLHGGLSSIGDRHLQAAEMGLRTARTKYDIGRQREQDRLNRPRQEAEAKLYQGHLDEAAAPFHVSRLAPNMNAMEHFMWVDDGGDPRRSAVKSMEKKIPLFTKFAEMFDSDIDTKAGSPTRGFMISRKTGKPITNAEIHQNSQNVMALMRANSGLDHAVRANEETLQRAFQSGQIDKATYDAQMKQIKDFKGDIPRQIRVAQDNVDFLSKFGNTKNPLFLQSEITAGKARWEAKLASLQGKLEKREASALEHARKKEIEGMKREPKYGDKITYQLGDKQINEIYRGGGKWERVSGPKWDDKKGDDKKDTQKRLLINDAMKHLGNNLGYGDDWSGITAEGGADKKTHAYYMKLTGRLAGADPDKYQGDPTTLADDTRELELGASRFASEMIVKFDIPEEDPKYPQMVERLKMDYITRTFGGKPDPKIHNGRIIRDPESGVREKAINGKWQRIDENGLPIGSYR